MVISRTMKMSTTSDNEDDLLVVQARTLRKRKIETSSSSDNDSDSNDRTFTEEDEDSLESKPPVDKKPRNITSVIKQPPPPSKTTKYEQTSSDDDDDDDDDDCIELPSSSEDDSSDESSDFFDCAYAIKPRNVLMTSNKPTTSKQAAATTKTRRTNNKKNPFMMTKNPNAAQLPPLITLKRYQLNAVELMSEKEKRFVDVSIRDHDGNVLKEHRIKSRNGTIALAMGKGKTFVILEYIRRRLCEDKNLKFLVLVPYSLIGQWTQEASRFYSAEFIDTHCLFANTVHKFKNLEESLRTKQVFVVNSKLLSKQNPRGCANRAQFKPYHYSAIIMDEEIFTPVLPADSETSKKTNHNRYHFQQQASNRDEFSFDFAWLISANQTIEPFSVEARFDSFDGAIQTYMADSRIDNTHAGVDAEQLEFKVNEHVVLFKAPPRTGDMTSTGDNVFNLLSGTSQIDLLNAKIATLKKTIEDIDRKVEQSEKDKKEKEKDKDKDKDWQKNEDRRQVYIQSLKESRAKASGLLETILRRDINNMCPVCYENFSHEHKKIYLPCCHNTMCHSCIIALGSGFTCPMCRSSSLGQILDELKALRTAPGSSECDGLTGVDGEGSKLMSFALEFARLMKRLEGKSLIVYEHRIDDTDLRGEHVLDELLKGFERPPVVLRGNNATITATLTRFQNDPNERFMLINSVYFNFGLNLQFVDNLVVLNEITSQKQSEQIIGRLLRLGRKKDVEKYVFKASHEQQ